MVSSEITSIPTRWLEKCMLHRFKLPIKMKIVLQVAKQSFGWIFVLYTSFLYHVAASVSSVFSLTSAGLVQMQLWAVWSVYVLVGQGRDHHIWVLPHWILGFLPRHWCFIKIAEMYGNSTSLQMASKVVAKQTKAEEKAVL